MRHQETIERYRRARKGGTDGDLTVLEGLHPVKHALRFDARVLEALTPDPERPLGLARELAPDVEEGLSELLETVTEEAYRELVPRPPSSGVIALARRAGRPAAEILALDGRAPVVLLDRPTHLGNLGAAVRAAAGAGAAGVVATGRHDPWHPAALRGSAGLHYAVPVAGASELPSSGRPVVAVDPGGDPLERCGGLPPRALLAFGSERRGLPPELLDRADRRVRIPMEPGVSSLNLATSVAVLLYAWRLAR